MKKITLPKTCCEAFEVSILHKLLFAVKSEIENVVFRNHKGK